MPKYKVKRYTTEVSTAEMEVELYDGEVELTKQRLEEEAEEIDNSDWDYISDYPAHRYEFEEIL